MIPYIGIALGLVLAVLSVILQFGFGSELVIVLIVFGIGQVPALLLCSSSDKPHTADAEPVLPPVETGSVLIIVLPMIKKLSFF